MIMLMLMVKNNDDDSKRCVLQLARRKHFMCLSMGQESGGGPQSIYWTMLHPGCPGQQLLFLSSKSCCNDLLVKTLFIIIFFILTHFHELYLSYVFVLVHQSSACLFTNVFVLRKVRLHPQETWRLLLPQPKTSLGQKGFNRYLGLLGGHN